MTEVIITVTTEVPEKDLHACDIAVSGVYGVQLGDAPGMYSPEPRGTVEQGDDPRIEAALDVFHDTIPIKVLDDFAIEAHLAEEGAVPEDLNWL